MAETNLEQPSSTPPPPPARGKAMLWLPLVPVVVAIGVALAVKHYKESGPPATRSGLPVDAIAPDFSLIDAHAGEEDPPVTLSLLAKKGPVLVIFYLGYSCPRCVSHLAEIDSMKKQFEAAGLQIIAISPDSPANTRDSIESYGDFHFPLLYDKEAKAARAFGLREEPDNPLHGAFIVDTQRRIRFADAGDHPCTDLEGLVAVGKKIQSGK